MSLNKIAIMIPQRDGMISDATSNSLRELDRWLHTEKPPWAVRTDKVVGNTVIWNARSQLVALALGWGADKLVFLDDDVSFSPEQFRLLIEAPHAVVTGTYAMRPMEQGQRDLAPVTLLFSEEARDRVVPTEFDEDGFCTVCTTGFGFLRVDRDAMAALAPHKPLLTDMRGMLDPVSRLFYRDWFCRKLISRGPDPVTREITHEYLTADAAFIDDLAGLGIECKFHRDLVCGHHYGPIRYMPTVLTDALQRVEQETDNAES